MDWDLVIKTDKIMFHADQSNRTKRHFSEIQVIYIKIEKLFIQTVWWKLIKNNKFIQIILILRPIFHHMTKTCLVVWWKIGFCDNRNL